MTVLDLCTLYNTTVKTIRTPPRIDWDTPIGTLQLEHSNWNTPIGTLQLEH
jgi:hypothetical protein